MWDILKCMKEKENSVAKFYFSSLMSSDTKEGIVGTVALTNIPLNHPANTFRELQQFVH